MKIFYDLNGSLYANITNKCPCDCAFCLRKSGSSVGDNDSLWLEHEPDINEIKAAFDAVEDKSRYKEVTFCGYGEPMERPCVLLETAKHIKRTTDMKIRINTNGLVSLIHPTFDLYSMRGFIDSISISLNASDPEKYNKLVRPKFGLASYNSMLNFAMVTSSFIPNVTFTVVDVMGEEELEACRVRAHDLRIPLRVRSYISDNVSYK